MTQELLIEGNELRKYMSKRWPHVLVDEFQVSSMTVSASRHEHASKCDGPA
jgi:superfamily I DNA/RNA helicase